VVIVFLSPKRIHFCCEDAQQKTVWRRSAVSSEVEINQQREERA
jgi:hypothetical protein